MGLRRYHTIREKKILFYGLLIATVIRLITAIFIVFCIFGTVSYTIFPYLILIQISINGVSMIYFDDWFFKLSFVAWIIFLGFFIYLYQDYYFITIEAECYCNSDVILT